MPNRDKKGEEKAVGIVTERDLLKRVLAKSRDQKKMKVRQIMSKPLIVGGGKG